MQSISEAAIRVSRGSQASEILKSGLEKVAGTFDRPDLREAIDQILQSL
jgi:hypothetical protein